MNFNSQKLIKILNIITTICGTMTLILFFIEGIKFDNPITWIICLLVVSSISTLIVEHTHNKR